MLKLFKNKKAQNTAEYAILIALVVGGVIAMQTYAQRALQGRIRDASVLLRSSTNEIGNTLQYEPYYVNTSAQVDKSQSSIDTYADQTRSTLSTKKAGDQTWDVTAYSSNAVAGTGMTGEENF